MSLLLFLYFFTFSISLHLQNILPFLLNTLFSFSFLFIFIQAKSLHKLTTYEENDSRDRTMDCWNCCFSIHFYRRGTRQCWSANWTCLQAVSGQCEKPDQIRTRDSAWLTKPTEPPQAGKIVLTNSRLFLCRT